MDFDLDPAQQVIADLTAQVLSASDTDAPGTQAPEIKTPGTTAPEADSSTVWKAMASAGLLSLALPGRLGGDDLDAMAILTVLTEVGRRASAVPALATLALGVLPLVRWGSQDLQDQVLPSVATGDLLLTAALREPSDPHPHRPRTTLARDGTVTGVKVGVPQAQAAGRILATVTATASTADVTGTPVVVLVDPAAGGVALTRTPASGDAPEYTVEFVSAPAQVLGGQAAVIDLYRIALAAACATGDGALAGALALTAAHVGTREQFGRPLAAFQAVAQQIADVYLASRALHLAAIAAAWQVRSPHTIASGGTQAEPEDVDVAAYWLAGRALEAVRTCHHLHGGLGLDVTYPLHRHSAILRDLARFVGGAEHLLTRLGGGRVS